MTLRAETSHSFFGVVFLFVLSSVDFARAVSLSPLDPLRHGHSLADDWMHCLAKTQTGKLRTVERI